MYGSEFDCRYGRLKILLQKKATSRLEGGRCAYNGMFYYQANKG